MNHLFVPTLFSLPILSFWRHKTTHFLKPLCLIYVYLTLTLNCHNYLKQDLSFCQVCLKRWNMRSAVWSNEYSMLIIHKHGLVHNPQFCTGLQDQTQYFKSLFIPNCFKKVYSYSGTIWHIPNIYQTLKKSMFVCLTKYVST